MITEKRDTLYLQFSIEIFLVRNEEMINKHGYINSCDLEVSRIRPI